MSSLNIAIAGAGIGGLTAAIALHRAGHHVTVFEQSKAFLRVGADINLTPNAVRALDGLGVGAAVRIPAARPTHRISRMWDSGEETSRLEMSDAAEQKYGAPQLTIHRADLLAALADVFPQTQVQFGKRAEQVTQTADGIELRFKDGSRHVTDLLIGADGIHSVVRNALFGDEQPRFTGVVAYRAVVPAESVAHVPNIQAFTKWWGPTPQSQIVTFPLNQGRDIFIFATTAQDSWRRVVSGAALAGIPTPAFSSSLAYYDGLRAKRLPAALVQGQRDFFGAHTYKRTDKDGTFHTLWSGDRTEIATEGSSH